MLLLLGKEWRWDCPAGIWSCESKAQWPGGGENLYAPWCLCLLPSLESPIIFISLRTYHWALQYGFFKLFHYNYIIPASPKGTFVIKKKLHKAAILMPSIPYMFSVSNKKRVKWARWGSLITVDTALAESSCVEPWSFRENGLGDGKQKSGNPDRVVPLSWSQVLSAKHEGLV